MDRRKNERHNVSGTAWFRWKDTDGTSREQTGNLRNVSAGGLFVETRNAPPVGTEILVHFEFNRSDNSRSVSIKTKGWVNRVEGISPYEQGFGFGASTGRMRLLRTSDAEGIAGRTEEVQTLLSE